jgi:hypothetical protein
VNKPGRCEIKIAADSAQTIGLCAAKKVFIKYSQVYTGCWIKNIKSRNRRLSSCRVLLGNNFCTSQSRSGSLVPTDLESTGILNKKIYAEIPPRVEHSISKKCYALFPIVDAMHSWGELNVKA